MRILSLCLFLCVAVKVQEANKIETKVKQFFESQLYKTFYEQWKKFREPIENSIELMLKETFGEGGMNVYVRRLSDPLKLSDGVFVCDNIVKVLFKDLYLTEMPHLINPEVSFDLASNVLVLEAKVNRMFIRADYQLFRNLSDVTYSSKKFDSFKTSPFNLQQVKNYGDVTIVAEDCTLSGMVIASLQDHTVNLGLDTIKLTDCSFSVEISTPGLGSPPVIAPYFSKEQGLELQFLLSEPIRQELLPKLQGAVFSYVNTSAIFGIFLPKIRQKQHNLFKHTWSFLTDVTRNVNQMTLTKKRGIDKWNDITINWSDKINDELQDYKLVLQDMTITGLDSAYSAHNGGPYRRPNIKICDTIRLSALQIRGTLLFSVGAAQSKYIFYGEVHDISSYVSIGVDFLKHRSKAKLVSEHHFEVSGWRDFDLHAPNLPLIFPHSLISGIILHELPHLVNRRLFPSFYEAIEMADKKAGGEVGKTQLQGKKNLVEESENKNEEVNQHDTDQTQNDEDENQKSKDDNQNVETENQNDDDENQNDDDVNQNDENNQNENQNVKIEHNEDDNTDDIREANHGNEASNNKNDNNMFSKNMFDKQVNNKPMFDENMFGNMFGGKPALKDDDDIDKTVNDGVENNDSTSESAEKRVRRSGKGRIKKRKVARRNSVTDNEIHSE